MKSDFANYERSKSPEGRAIYEAPDFGTIYLAWSKKGLTELWLPQRWEWIDEPQMGPSRNIPAKWSKVLGRYFAGVATDLRDIPVDPVGTKFQKRVWAALRRIPHGEVRSYGSIARTVGSPQAMRAVGGANGRNPISIVIPCHRVVRVGNHLGGYSAGLPMKRKLLRLEGIQVRAGKVLPGQLDLAGLSE